MSFFKAALFTCRVKLRILLLARCLGVVFHIWLVARVYKSGGASSMMTWMYYRFVICRKRLSSGSLMAVSFAWSLILWPNNCCHGLFHSVHLLHLNSFDKIHRDWLVRVEVFLVMNLQLAKHLGQSCFKLFNVLQLSHLHRIVWLHGWDSPKMQIIVVKHFLVLTLTNRRSLNHGASCLLMMRLLQKVVVLAAWRFLELKQIMTRFDSTICLILGIAASSDPFIKELNALDLVLFLHSPEIAVLLLLIIWVLRRNNLCMFVFDAPDLLL